MSESSDFLVDLRRNGRWPPLTTTHVATIGARSDLVVPAHHTRLGGIPSTVVAPFGETSPLDHGRLPGSPEAAVEIARIIGGQMPTCEAIEDVLIDELTSRQAADVQDRVALAATAAGFYADHRIKAPFKSAAIAQAKKALVR